MIKKTLIAFTTLLSFAALAADPATNPYQTAPQKENTMEKVNAVEAQAKVLSIDKKKRELKLKNDEGREFTIHAGDEVKNFDKIKKGDLIKVSYLESLTWELKKNSNEPIGITENSDVTTAEPGQKPAGIATEKITARGVVTKVDTKDQSITVKGAKNSVVLKVPKPEILKDIKVGDKIEATYSEAMAISVESVIK